MVYRSGGLGATWVIPAGTGAFPGLPLKVLVLGGFLCQALSLGLPYTDHVLLLLELINFSICFHSFGYIPRNRMTKSYAILVL